MSCSINPLAEAARVSHTPRFPRVVLNMSRDELLVEWRAQEDALLAYDQLVDAVIDAVWGPDDETSERPTDDEPDNAGLVAGIDSLHELNDRLMLENERLRVERDQLRVRLRENCQHHWQATGGASHPNCWVVHERCTRCGEERSIETPRELGLDAHAEATRG